MYKCIIHVHVLSNTYIIPAWLQTKLRILDIQVQVLL